MPEPGSTIINQPSDSEMRIRSRWDALPDRHPSAADLDRCTCEVSNYKTQQWKYCNRPFRFSISPQISHPILQDLQITPDECYDFCWKSCAVYCLVNPGILGMRPTMLDFFHAIWRCWFKGDETNVSWNNFFGKCIACWEDPDTANEPTTSGSIPKRLLATTVDIPTLIAHHRALCAHVETRLAEPPPEDKRLYHENCEMRPLFEKVLIVVDRVNWDWDGLSIVRSDQAHPLRLECNNFDIPQPAFREGDQGQVFRARLEDAVRLVESMRARENDRPR